MLAVFTEILGANAFNPGFCNTHSPILSALKHESGAFAYCSQYLGYGTKTM